MRSTSDLTRACAARCFRSVFSICLPAAMKFIRSTTKTCSNVFLITATAWLTGCRNFIGANGGWTELELAFYGQAGKNCHAQSPPQAGVGFAAVPDDAGFVVFQPLQPLARSQLHFVGLRRHLVGKQVFQLAGQGFAGNQQSHLGVEPGRARVEIERADEQAPAVYRESFGVQAGAGAERRA